jgi:tape measure domain-containing protein
MLVGEAFARMGLDSKQFKKDLSGLEGVTRREATTLGAVFKNAFSVALGMGVFEAVKRGFQAIASTSISFNAQMEQARIGFTTMLGSAERAEAFLSDMAEFAAKTPFEFPELLDASKRMLAYGFAAEDVLPTMEAVGNASAAVGLGTEGINRIILALGQMRAKGKLSAEEMRQLTETGIPAWEILAEAMNKTTAEIMDMQSKGLIPADRAIKMLVEGMNKRFPDMMKNMENTWEGVTSTIKDVWRMTIGAVTQNLFQGVVSWLQKVRDFAVGFYDTFQKYGLQRAISESFGPEVAAMVSVLGATLRGLASVVSAVTGFIAQYGKQIRFVAVVMGTYLVLLKTVTLANRGVSVAVTNLRLVTAALAGESLATSGILGFVSKVIGIYQMQIHLASLAGIAHVGVIEAVKTALWSLYAAIPAVGWALLAITAVLTGGIVAWGKYQQSLFKASQEKYAEQIRRSQEKIKQSQEQMADSTKKATKGTKDQAAALGKLGKAAQDNLQSFDEVHTLMEDMGDVPGLDVPGLDVPELDIDMPDLSAFDDMFDDMFEGFEQESASFQGFVGWLWDGIKEKFNGFKTWLGTTWLGGFWDGVKTTWSSFKEWAGGLWDSIKGIWGGFKDWFLGWAIPLWDGVKGAWGGFKDWFLGWAIPLWDGVKETWGGFKKFAADMWDGAKEKWTGFKDFAGNTWDGIKTTIQEKWNTLKTEAPLVWDNIKTTVSTSWNTLKTEAPIVWGNIKDSISTKWDELKTNAPIVWGNIKTTISTSWDELKTNAPTTWENIKKGISERWEELKTNAPTTWENIKTEISDRWEALKEDTPKTWDEIAGKLAEIWDGIKTSASEKWEGVKTVIKGAINGIIGFINKFIKAWNKIELKVPSINIPLIGTVGGWSVRLPQIPEIPMLAKGGLVMDPTLAMLGEAGPEAVIPLGRSGFADEIAQAVYQAIMDAIRISRASSPQSSDDKELVLKIDNTVLARMQLPALTREAQRQGFDLVLRPQGV